MLNPEITASVIICTRNRAAPLARALASVADMTVPDGLIWQIIVIDNGSTDDTRAVIESFKDRLPIHYDYEAQPGLSFARNRGVSVAQGRYIIWTDDDVTVSADWLQAYVEAFARHPEATIFGGAVCPVLEEPTPSWVKVNRADLRYLLAERELVSEPTPFTALSPELPVGANFAVRAKEQKAEIFDVYLGASPKFNRLGEEEQVIRAILSSGSEGWWVPSARVHHHIPPERQTLKYVIKYNRAGGETWAYLGVKTQAAPKPRGLRRLCSAPAWVWKRFFTDYATFLCFKLLNQPQRWFPSLCSYAYFKGALSYLYRG